MLQGNEPVIQLPYVGGTQIIPWTCIVNADPTTRGIPVLPPSCITSQDAFKTTLERFNTLSEDRRRLVNIQPQDQDEGELLVLDTILDLFDEFDATRSNEGDFEASSNTMLSLLQPEYRKKAPKGPGSRDGVDYWVCKWPGCRHTTPRYPNAVSHVYAHAKIKPFPCNIWYDSIRLLSFIAHIPLSLVTAVSDASMIEKGTQRIMKLTRRPIQDISRTFGTHEGHGVIS